jgi:hypothetical protein
MIQTGAFVVSQWDQDRKQILFQTKVDVSPTPEQLDLKSQVEQTLTALQIIFGRDEKFISHILHNYFHLLKLGLLGLPLNQTLQKWLWKVLRLTCLPERPGE